MSEETNQQTAGQGNPEEATAASERTAQTSERNPQPNTSTESELTPEQIQEIRDFQARLDEANITDPKAFYADYTRKAQTAAEAQRQLEQLQQQNVQYQQAIQSMSGGQPHAASTPEQRLWAEIKDAREEYDFDREQRAQDELLQLRIQRAEQNASQRAIQAMEARQHLRPAADILGTDESSTLRDLHAFQSTMTPEQMAVAKLYADGRLDEFVERQQKQKAVEAQRAQLSTGMGARANGASAFNEPEENPHPPPMQWYSLSNRARKAHVEKHGWPPYDPEGGNSR